MAMKIHLIHPSRSRPEKAFNTTKKWLEKAGAKVFCTLSLDNDDPTIIQYEKLYCVESFWLTGMSGILYGDNKSVVEATNEAAAAVYDEGADIFVYLSDDFDCPDNWGQLILKEFEGVTEPMLLHVDDCLQPMHARVLTIPIMNRQLYNKLGYFFHPEYRSMHVDTDLYETCNRIRAIKKAPHLKFPHEHVSIGKAQDDETYRRSAANWNQGLEVFNRRKKLGFPI